MERNKAERIWSCIGNRKDQRDALGPLAERSDFRECDRTPRVIPDSVSSPMAHLEPVVRALDNVEVVAPKGRPLA